MANKPLRPCRRPGCSRLVPGGYCDLHKPKAQRGAESESWRWMYKTALWLEDLRPAQLLAEPWCYECSRLSMRVRATDVDHAIPHRGDWAKFIDRKNLRSLCHNCHSRKTMLEILQKSGKKSRR